MQKRPTSIRMQFWVGFEPLLLDQSTYPRPLPDDTSDPVALVEERVVYGRKAGILEEQAALQALPLQGGVLLPLEGLHRREHPAALKRQVTKPWQITDLMLLNFH